MKKFKIGKIKIKFVKDRPGRLRYALITKINKEIKWKPRTSLDKGLSDTIDWYLNNKILKFHFEKFRNERLDLIYDKKRYYFIRKVRN